MKRRYFRLTVWSMVCLCMILIGCNPAAQTPLIVGSNVWPGYEPLYLARNLGYYRDHPIELRDYPSATEVSQALRNGDIEVAALTLDETLLVSQTIPDVRVILITDFSHGADVLMAKPGIKTLKDLQGRKVAVEPNAVGGYVLTRALEQAGLSLQQIQTVTLGVSEHEQAYRQNRVDAVVTFEPVRSHLLQAGAKILFDSSQIPGEIIDVLVVHQSLLTERQADLRVLLQGWFRALDYNQKNPEDAARKMAVRQRVTPEQFIASLKLITIPDHPTNLKLLSKTDPSFLQNAQRLSKLMVDRKLLDRAIPVEPLLQEKIIQSLIPST